VNNPPRRPNRRFSARKRPRGKAKVACYRGAWDLGANLGIALLEVSETGALVLLRAALPPSQVVTLMLQGQWHLRPIRMPGKVVWCAAASDNPEAETFRAGIEFEKRLPWADLMQIS
jgi:hypothetical protein